MEGDPPVVDMFRTSRGMGNLQVCKRIEKLYLLKR